MKKIFLSLIAIAGLSILFISCERGNSDALVPANPDVIDPRILVTSADSTGVFLKVPETTPENSPIHLVGELNGWNVADTDPKYVFKMINKTTYRLTVPVALFGTNTERKFKPVRGNSWNFEPLKADGSAMADQTLKKDPGKLMTVTVEKWKS
ncbi:MAG TPA: hypothetical protein VM012_11305 [Flavitalea sp.]|nr:hypothetical protein [Flavitalea sp.]